MTLLLGSHETCDLCGGPLGNRSVALGDGGYAHPAGECRGDVDEAGR